jgi:hypothetical protein
MKHGEISSSADCSLGIGYSDWQIVIACGFQAIGEKPENPGLFRAEAGYHVSGRIDRNDKTQITLILEAA